MYQDKPISVFTLAHNKQMRDFTHESWKMLCTALQTSGFSILRVSDYLTLNKNGNLPKKFAILRHDIDRRSNHALMMAELENSLGIQSTYYFRIPYTFDKNSIRNISQMGHEVGFHYECLSKADGDIDKAHSIFQNELSSLREVCDVQSICMHGRPLSAFDNREMWANRSFAEYNVLGEAYLSVNNVYYFTDTGRSWGSSNSVRDVLDGSLKHPVIKSSEELAGWLKEIGDCGIYITSHPERWAFSGSDLIYCSVKDCVMNTGKKIIRKVRK